MAIRGCIIEMEESLSVGQVVGRLLVVFTRPREVRHNSGSRRLRHVPFLAAYGLFSLGRRLHRAAARPGAIGAGLELSIIFVKFVGDIDASRQSSSASLRQSSSIRKAVLFCMRRPPAALVSLSQVLALRRGK